MIPRRAGARQRLVRHSDTAQREAPLWSAGASFAYAIAADWLVRSPCRNIKLRSVATRRRQVTPEQHAALAEAMDSRKRGSHPLGEAQTVNYVLSRRQWRWVSSHAEFDIKPSEWLAIERIPVFTPLRPDHPVTGPRFTTGSTRPGPGSCDGYPMANAEASRVGGGRGE